MSSGRVGRRLCTAVALSDPLVHADGFVVEKTLLGVTTQFIEKRRQFLLFHALCDDLQLQQASRAYDQADQGAGIVVRKILNNRYFWMS